MCHTSVKGVKVWANKKMNDTRHPFSCGSFRLLVSLLLTNDHTRGLLECLSGTLIMILETQLNKKFKINLLKNLKNELNLFNHKQENILHFTVLPVTTLLCGGGNRLWCGLISEADLQPSCCPYTFVLDTHIWNGKQLLIWLRFLCLDQPQADQWLFSGLQSIIFYCASM